jgi:hypothetical protein
LRSVIWDITTRVSGWRLAAGGWRLTAGRPGWAPGACGSRPRLSTALGA